MYLLLLLLAILPGVLISVAIFRADKFEREPIAPLALCFAAGGVATLPAVAAERWAFDWAVMPPFQWVRTLALAFIALALNEEAFKFVLLLVLAFPRSYFNEPLDGIVYAVLIAMGFATMENVMYADRFGLQTVLLRALTAVPAHLVFAVVQGYYAGLAKFDPPGRNRLLARGFLLAVLLHGTYDLLLIQHCSKWLVVLGTASLYLGLFACSQLIAQHLQHSPFRKD